MNFLIILLAGVSYFMGAKAITQNKYTPSIYSRVIWLLLAINGFASVVVLKNSSAVIWLAGLNLAGSLIILLASLRKSKRVFGVTEFISTILVGVSLAIWIFTIMPFLNLTIGLTVFLIGGIPTYLKVIKNPRDEDIFFWLFFALASLLTLIEADKSNISKYLYPLFFVFFDGGMTLLCLRRYITN